MSENNGNNNNNTSETANDNAGINIFDAISADDAYQILQRLANKNQKVAIHIEEVAEYAEVGVRGLVGSRFACLAAFSRIDMERRHNGRDKRDLQDGCKVAPKSIP